MYASDAIQASLGRAISSSLFAYLLFALGGGYAASFQVAKMIAVEESTTAFLLTAMIAYVAANLIAGFVAGYRAAGRGLPAGLLVGCYGLLVPVFALWIVTVKPWPGLSVWGNSNPNAQFFVLVVWLIAVIPAGIFGGLSGQALYPRRAS